VLGHRRVLLHRFVGEVRVEAFARLVDAAHDGIGEDGVAVRADHAVAIARARPLRQPAAFAVGVEIPFEHLGGAGRVEQAEQREVRAVRVPEAVVGIERPGVDVPVERAVVDLLVALVELVERVREEFGSVEAGVERRALLVINPLQLDLPELLVPRRLGLLCEILEAERRDFALEVQLCLLGTDEGCRDAHLDRPVEVLPLHIRAGGVAAHGVDAFARESLIPFKCAEAQDRPGKLDREVHREVRRRAVVIVVRVPGDHRAVDVDVDRRRAVHALLARIAEEDQPGEFALGELDLHRPAALRGDEREPGAVADDLRLELVRLERRLVRAVRPRPDWSCFSSRSPVVGMSSSGA
jgi:hypothetical protein